MRNIKIIQCGDIHFDTPFKGLSKEVAMLRRAELKESFSRMINIGLEEKIDMFLLTGDIFDNCTVEKSTLNFIQKEMERVIDIPVFIATGNHDPYNAESFYSMIKWPRNVHIFGADMDYIEISNLNTVIYGASFKERYCKESKLKNFKIEEKHKNLIKLMVMHGNITNSECGHYNPITLEDIANSQIDYIAMGHIHKFSGINKVKDTYYSYAGCLDGRGFDECGDKGIIIGEINKEFCNLNFQAISKRKYINLKINISNCITMEDIKEKIIEQICVDSRTKDLLSIILIGNVSEDLNICVKTLENILKDKFFYIKIKDKTNLKIDFNNISQERSLRGMFCHKILNEIHSCNNEEEEEILQLALRIGMKAILNQEVNLNDN